MAIEVVTYKNSLEVQGSRKPATPDEVIGDHVDLLATGYTGQSGKAVDGDTLVVTEVFVEPSARGLRKGIYVRTLNGAQINTTNVRFETGEPGVTQRAIWHQNGRI